MNRDAKIFSDIVSFERLLDKLGILYEGNTDIIAELPLDYSILGN